MKARPVTEEERALFVAALGGAGGQEADAKPAEESATHKTGTKPAPGARRPSGLDGRTAERLRKGAIEPDERLDLHGFTEAAAHRALTMFLHAAYGRGARLVLVVTGKGLNPRAPDEPFDLELDRRTRGVLKAMAPRWLQQPQMLQLIADVRPAHRRHGGSGALYVYLRKERKPA